MIQAYAVAQDRQGYQDAQIEAGGDCLDADINGAEQRYGMPKMEADNMEVGAAS